MLTARPYMEVYNFTRKQIYTFRLKIKNPEDIEQENEKKWCITQAKKHNVVYLLRQFTYQILGKFLQLVTLQAA